LPPPRSLPCILAFMSPPRGSSRPSADTRGQKQRRGGMEEKTPSGESKRWTIQGPDATQKNETKGRTKRRRCEPTGPVPVPREGGSRRRAAGAAARVRVGCEEVDVAPINHAVSRGVQAIA
jgi:hypothetical protein